MTGIVTGFEIGKNQNGTKDVILLQVRLRDEKDIQTIELMSPPGDDSIPPLGAKVVILQVSNSYKIAIAQSDNITPSMAEGEKKLYSQAGDVIKAFINLLNDGIIELNGDTDFAVAFDDLKAGFDTLKSDFNTFISSTYNVHTHVSVTSLGAPTPPVPTGSSSAASIDAAKVEGVKLP